MQSIQDRKITLQQLEEALKNGILREPSSESRSVAESKRAQLKIYELETELAELKTKLYSTEWEVLQLKWQQSIKCLF